MRQILNYFFRRLDGTWTKPTEDQHTKKKDSCIIFKLSQILWTLPPSGGRKQQQANVHLQFNHSYRNATSISKDELVEH